MQIFDFSIVVNPLGLTQLVVQQRAKLIVSSIQVNVVGQSGSYGISRTALLKEADFCDVLCMKMSGSEGRTLCVCKCLV